MDVGLGDWKGMWNRLSQSEKSLMDDSKYGGILKSWSSSSGGQEHSNGFEHSIAQERFTEPEHCEADYPLP